MFKLCVKLIVTVLSLMVVQPLVFAADERMQVDVVADTEQLEVNWLHANVRKAAALALPQLWNRIIPLSVHGLIPQRVKAIQFLKKASPTETGVRIVFNQQRVLNYLKRNNLPYIAQQPAFNVIIQLYNEAGGPMSQTANALLGYAAYKAISLGYRMDDQGASLVLLWRWLDHQQVSLNLRGNSKLGEFSAIRQLDAGDPLEQLKPWLTEVLLQARDAYAESDIVKVDAVPFEAKPNKNTGIGFAAQPIEKMEIELQLVVQRQASLADQVQFEEALQGDPRILNLFLRQVNQEGQQYGLQLKGSDDQWLTAWFARRGMTLTPTIEGWVAR